MWNLIPEVVSQVVQRKNLKGIRTVLGLYHRETSDNIQRMEQIFVVCHATIIFGNTIKKRKVKESKEKGKNEFSEKHR